MDCYLRGGTGGGGCRGYDLLHKPRCFFRLHFSLGDLGSMLLLYMPRQPTLKTHTHVCVCVCVCEWGRTVCARCRGRHREFFEIDHSHHTVCELGMLFG